MKRGFLFVVVFFILIATVFSQDYKTGIGLRGGWTSGLTIKYFLKPEHALEGILSTNWGWRGYKITGLYEIHKVAFNDDVKGMYWYYGGGVHFGEGGYHYYRRKYNPNGTEYWEKRNYIAFGIDGIVGLEYKIQEIPITLSLDVKPYIDFVSYKDSDLPFRFWDSALSIRYVF